MTERGTGGGCHAGRRQDDHERLMARRQRISGEMSVGHSRCEAFGVAGAVAVFVGVSLLLALSTPPFYPRDEQAHLGYAHAVASGELPEIDTFQSVPRTATEWQTRYDANPDDRYRQIWVANHPPLNYVLAAPGVWLADALERPDGGLMLLRFLNIGLAAVGLVFVYLLTIELSGGDRRLGFLAATVVALLPQPPAFFGRAFIDGLGFATITLLLWAAARYLRRGHSPQSLALLSVAVALACLSRASGLLVAMAVVAVVLALGLARALGSLWSRLRRLTPIGLALVGPAALVSGWFYVRNIALYGDIGASSYLLERFDREPRGSIWSHAVDIDWFGSLFAAIATRPFPGYFDTYHRNYGWVVGAVFVLALVGLVLGPQLRARLMAARHREVPPAREAAALPRAAIVMSLVAAAVVLLAMAQHVSGGGLPHLRYLYPSLGVIVALVVIGLDRLVPKVLPVALVAAQGVLLSQLAGPTSDVLRLQVSGMPEGLDFVPSSATTRGLAAALAIAGGAVVAAALLAQLTELRRPPAVAGEGGIGRGGDQCGDRPSGPGRLRQRGSIGDGAHRGSGGQRDDDNDVTRSRGSVSATEAATGTYGRAAAQGDEDEDREPQEAGGHQHG
jgi:hypothetical protein